MKFRKSMGLFLSFLLVFNLLNSSTIFAYNLSTNVYLSENDDTNLIGVLGENDFIATGVKDNTKTLTKQYGVKNNFKYVKNGIVYNTSAFDFHIFSKKAILNAHTNGNIATKDVLANGQGFGTNQSTAFKLNEENYFMNSVDRITNIASDGNIVIGNNVPVKFEDNNNSLNIGTNGNKLTSDQSSRVYQETKESNKYIDIDQELEKLKIISKLLSTHKTSEGVTLGEPNGENQTITVNGSINNYYLNIGANEISNGSNKRVLNISIPDNKTLIINVDMAGTDIDSLQNLVTKINGYENSEDVVKYKNNVLWNLYNSSAENELFTTGAEYAKVGTSDYFMGTILAPNANIQYGAVNGSIIANETMQNYKESHKWDFTGHEDLEDPEDTADKSISVVIEATKILEGKELIADMFSFELLDKDKNVLQTVTNDADGKIKFEAITYKEAGNYEYKVREVKGDLKGITYDERVFDLTVNVTDDGTGKLVATINYPDGGIEFINKYEAKSTSIVLRATKTLEGKALEADMFSFELLDKDKNVLQTVTNDADGKIKFEAITYKEAGNYEYKVREVKGDLKGVIYDERVFDVTVNVTDNGEGNLVATVNYPEEKIVFENKLIKGSLEIVMTDSKDGKPLKDVEITIRDSEGKVVQVGKTDSDGKVVFEDIKYGKYTYQETLAKEGYVIDNKEYSFEIKENEVVVKDSMINERKTEIPNDLKKPNNPEKPNDKETTKEMETSSESKKTSSPYTGDTGIAITLIIGVLGVGGLIINNKRKVRDENL